MQEIKNENSYFGEKVDLRARFLPEKDRVTVLDCYSADGSIWRAVKEKTGRDLRVLRIEKEPGKRGTYLPGDNLKYLASLDLNRFDVIDLDAFGVPYQQLRILFERGYRGHVFVTFIQTMFGRLPPPMLEEIGYSPAMLRKCPSIFSRKGRDVLFEFLALRGVSTVHIISKVRKHYLHFQT